MGIDNPLKIFDKIEAGLSLVFGSQPSVGFICGMKDAILHQQKKMPGYCCLDAPFELSGNAWGSPVSAVPDVDRSVASRYSLSY